MRQEISIDVVIMSKCTDHCFHKECLELQMNNSDNIRCAVCSQIYGVLTGQMPAGSMNWSQHKHKGALAGYPKDGYWEINYQFNSGKLPNGKRYSGTGRTAYLPDNKEGREVLALLVKAFERRLTFIVGTSVTTGATDTVVWSGIHHKTNTHGGSSSFGYPDVSYLNRVTLELADRGVTLDNPLEEVTRVTKSSKGSVVIN